MTEETDGTEEDFIMDTRSLVTIIPLDNKIIKDKKNYRYQRNMETSKNEVKIVGKITVAAANRGIRKYLTMFITEREDIKSIIGMNWLREFIWKIQGFETTTKKTNQSENDSRMTIFEYFFK